MINKKALTKKFIIIAIIALLIINISALFVYKPDILGFAMEENRNSIQIGAILPLSGSTAYYGSQSQNGIEIAKEEIAEDYPEFKFDIIYEDSFYTPKGGVDAYTQLKNINDIDAVITAASQVSLAIQPLSTEDNILQMAIFSSADKYSTLDDLSFRISTRNVIESGAVAKLIKENDYEKLAIIYLNNDFGVGFKDSLKSKLTEQEVSIDIVNEESFLLTDSDFRTILTKIKENNPDAIFMVGIAAKYALILQQAEELGIDSQFISMRSAEDPVLINVAGNLANGLIYTYPFDASSQSQEIENFVKAYKDKYGVVPDAYAAEGYEGFKLTALAFIECGKDYNCIQNYLTNLEDYNSIFGSLSFDESGDVNYGFFPKKVENEKFVRY